MYLFVRLCDGAWAMVRATFGTTLLPLCSHQKSPLNTRSADNMWTLNVLVNPQRRLKLLVGYGLFRWITAQHKRGPELHYGLVVDPPATDTLADS